MTASTKQAIPCTIAALLLSVSPFLVLEAAAQTSARDTPRAQIRTGSYPPLRLIDGPSGMKIPAGWQPAGSNQWVAAPGDPASPRMVRMVHSRPVTSPAAAFAEITALAGIAPVDVHSSEVTVWSVVSENKASRAWGTAAGSNMGGVEQALFASTFHNSSTNQWITELYTAPVHTYRQWGGVMTVLDNFGLSEHVEGLPRGFHAAAARATHAEQAQIYATLIDVTVTRVLMGSMQAAQGALETLQGIGRDIDLRTSCQMAANCTYSPGGMPGSATASYGPG